MATFGDIFDAFESTSRMAEATGLSDSHLRTMKARGSIPPEYWQDVVGGARKLSLHGVSYEALASAAAARRRGVRPSAEEARP